MSGFSTSIDLAHEAPFALGALTVRPSTREVARGDGVAEVLEPRVMQVLVALHRAGGAIVSRDDLTQSCWEGRVVGEDAINRVISRLRRTAEVIGEGAFRIETVTKVGYRLIVTGQNTTPPPSPPGERPEPATTRRLLLGTGVGAGVVALATGGWWWRGRGDPAPPAGPPADVAALMMQADLALQQDTREGQNQAIALYQQVVATEPRYADGWGALAYTYALTAHYRSTTESDAMRQRARSAADRALAIDPINAMGRLGMTDARPMMGNWWPIEQALRQALALVPDSVPLLAWLARVLCSVGRSREASDYQERVAKLHGPATPGEVFTRIDTMWAAGRQEEADQAMAEGARLYPTHFAIWFARFYTYLYSGRPGAALAMASDRDNLPSNIPLDEIDRVRQVALAAQSHDPAAADAVMRVQLAQAHLGAGLAENAIQFASVLGRLDDAFTVAEAYYFGRHWVVPEIRFSAAQGTSTPQGDRLTCLLFWPSTAPMRRDPRFATLVRDLGLEAYWRASGHQPDYRRA